MSSAPSASPHNASRRHLVWLASLALLFVACRKHAGDTCALRDGERACGEGLYCVNPTPGLLGLANERGTCRAYLAEGVAAEHAGDRCAAGLAVGRDGVCRRRVVAATNVVTVPFDAAGWGTGDPTKRIGMARALVASPEATCAGKATRDLERVWGPPDRVVSRDGGAPESGSHASALSWHLGLRESGGSLTFPYDEYLVAELDAQGVCTRISIRDDD